MHEPAEQFLRLRAFGTPAIVVALAAQGSFRGFKDTKTPLYAVGKYYNQIFHDILQLLLDILYSCTFGKYAIDQQIKHRLCTELLALQKATKVPYQGLNFELLA